MRSVGLKVLKNRLAEYVRLAASGETILIADRDRVVAELTPPQSGRAVQLSDAQLAQAVRDGLLTPALQRGGPLPDSQPIAPLREIVEGLATDRADR